MEDQWEIDNGLDPTDPTDAWKDPDYDRLNNLTEFQEGKTPRVDWSFVPIEGAVALESLNERGQLLRAVHAPSTAEYQLQVWQNGQWTNHGTLGADNKQTNNQLIKHNNHGLTAAVFYTIDSATPVESDLELRLVTPEGLVTTLMPLGYHSPELHKVTDSGYVFMRARDGGGQPVALVWNPVTDELVAHENHLLIDGNELGQVIANQEDQNGAMIPSSGKVWDGTTWRVINGQAIALNNHGQVLIAKGNNLSPVDVGGVVLPVTGTISDFGPDSSVEFDASNEQRWVFINQNDSSVELSDFSEITYVEASLATKLEQFLGLAQGSLSVTFHSSANTIVIEGLQDAGITQVDLYDNQTDPNLAYSSVVVEEAVSGNEVEIRLWEDGNSTPTGLSLSSGPGAYLNDREQFVIRGSSGQAPVFVEADGTQTTLTVPQDSNFTDPQVLITGLNENGEVAGNLQENSVFEAFSWHSGSYLFEGIYDDSSVHALTNSGFLSLGANEVVTQEVDTDSDGTIDQTTETTETRLGILVPGNDTNNNGLPDDWESFYGVTNPDGDPDGDGLLNWAEYIHYTHPGLPDSDADSIEDNTEITQGSDPAWAVDGDPLSDVDDDGLTLATELELGTNPGSRDSDGDDYDDEYEILNGLDPIRADGPVPTDDFVPFSFDPNSSHSDGDGIPDDYENFYGLNANTDDGDLDPDRDHLTNAQEAELGSNPNDAPGWQQTPLVHGYVHANNRDQVVSYSLVPATEEDQEDAYHLMLYTSGVWEDLGSLGNLPPRDLKINDKAEIAGIIATADDEGIPFRYRKEDDSLATYGSAAKGATVHKIQEDGTIFYSEEFHFDGTVKQNGTSFFLISDSRKKEIGSPFEKRHTREPYIGRSSQKTVTSFELVNFLESGPDEFVVTLTSQETLFETGDDRILVNEYSIYEVFAKSYRWKEGEWELLPLIVSDTNSKGEMVGVTVSGFDDPTTGGYHFGDPLDFEAVHLSSDGSITPLGFAPFVTLRDCGEHSDGYGIDLVPRWLGIENNGTVTAIVPQEHREGFLQEGQVVTLPLEFESQNSSEEEGYTTGPDDGGLALISKDIEETSVIEVADVNLTVTLAHDDGTLVGTVESEEWVESTSGTGTLEIRSQTKVWSNPHLGRPMLSSIKQASPNGFLYSGSAESGTAMRWQVHDQDGDGFSDDWERYYELSAVVKDDLWHDIEPDGLTNHAEYWLRTDPRDADTDDDGLEDGFEVKHNSDPLVKIDPNGDADEDGINNGLEIEEGTNPFEITEDNDGDNILDSWEAEHGFSFSNDADALDDHDRDGLNNLAEFRFITDPHNPDTDDDGVVDSMELRADRTSPTNALSVRDYSVSAILDPDTSHVAEIVIENTFNRELEFVVSALGSTTTTDAFGATVPWLVLPTDPIELPAPVEGAAERPTAVVPVEFVATGLYQGTPPENPLEVPIDLRDTEGRLVLKTSASLQVTPVIQTNITLDPNQQVRKGAPLTFTADLTIPQDFLVAEVEYYINGQRAGDVAASQTPTQFAAFVQHDVGESFEVQALAYDILGRPGPLSDPVTVTVELPEISADGDDLPDEWEFTHIINVDPNDEYDTIESVLEDDDFDNDNLSNLDEFIAGTDPAVKDSDGNGIWDGYEGRVRFHLQTAPDQIELDGGRLSRWIDSSEASFDAVSLNDQTAPTWSPDQFANGYGLIQGTADTGFSVFSHDLDVIPELADGFSLFGWLLPGQAAPDITSRVLEIADGVEIKVTADHKIAVNIDRNGQSQFVASELQIDFDSQWIVSVIYDATARELKLWLDDLPGSTTGSRSPHLTIADLDLSGVSEEFRFGGEGLDTAYAAHSAEWLLLNQNVPLEQRQTLVEQLNLKYQVGEMAPVVRLSQPTNNLIYTAPAQIPLEVEVRYSQLSIDRVEFYSGNRLIGQTTNGLLGGTLTALSAQSHLIHAKVYDSAGNEAVTNTVMAIVRAGDVGTGGTGTGTRTTTTTTTIFTVNPNSGGTIFPGGGGSPGTGGNGPVTGGGPGSGNGPGPNQHPEQQTEEVNEDDLDGDGIPNWQEAKMGLNPVKEDSDGDGRNDNVDWVPYDPAIDEWEKTEVPQFMVIETGEFIPLESNKFGMVLGYERDSGDPNATDGEDLPNYYVWYQGEWESNAITPPKGHLLPGTTILGQEYPVVFGAYGFTQQERPLCDPNGKPREVGLIRGWKWEPGSGNFSELAEVGPGGQDIVGSNIPKTVDANGTITGTGQAKRCVDLKTRTCPAGYNPTDPGEEIQTLGGEISWPGGWQGNSNWPEPGVGGRCECDRETNDDCDGEGEYPDEEIPEEEEKDDDEEDCGPLPKNPKKSSNDDYTKEGVVVGGISYRMEGKKQEEPGFEDRWDAFVEAWEEGDCDIDPPERHYYTTIENVVFIHNEKEQYGWMDVTQPSASGVLLKTNIVELQLGGPALVAATQADWERGDPEAKTSGEFTNPQERFWFTHGDHNDLVDIRDGPEKIGGKPVRAPQLFASRDFPTSDGLWANGYVHQWEELTGGYKIDEWHEYEQEKTFRLGKGTAELGKDGQPYDGGILLLPIEVKEVKPDGSISAAEKFKISSPKPRMELTNVKFLLDDPDTTSLKGSIELSGSILDDQTDRLSRSEQNEALPRNRMFVYLNGDRANPYEIEHQDEPSDVAPHEGESTYAPFPWVGQVNQVVAQDPNDTMEFAEGVNIARFEFQAWHGGVAFWEYKFYVEPEYRTDTNTYSRTISFDSLQSDTQVNTLHHTSPEFQLTETSASSNTFTSDTLPFSIDTGVFTPTGIDAIEHDGLVYNETGNDTQTFTWSETIEEDVVDHYEIDQSNNHVLSQSEIVRLPLYLYTIPNAADAFVDEAPGLQFPASQKVQVNDPNDYDSFVHHEAVDTGPVERKFKAVKDLDSELPGLNENTLVLTNAEEKEPMLISLARNALSKTARFSKRRKDRIKDEISDETESIANGVKAGFALTGLALLDGTVWLGGVALGDVDVDIDLPEIRLMIKDIALSSMPIPRMFGGFKRLSADVDLVELIRKLLQGEIPLDEIHLNVDIDWEKLGLPDFPALNMDAFQAAVKIVLRRVVEEFEELELTQAQKAAYITQILIGVGVVAAVEAFATKGKLTKTAFKSGKYVFTILGRIDKLNTIFGEDGFISVSLINFTQKSCAKIQ